MYEYCFLPLNVFNGALDMAGLEPSPDGALYRARVEGVEATDGIEETSCNASVTGKPALMNVQINRNLFATENNCYISFTNMFQ